MTIRKKVWHERNEEIWEQSRPLNMVLQQATGESKGRRVCRMCGKEDSVFVVINGFNFEESRTFIKDLLGNKLDSPIWKKLDGSKGKKLDKPEGFFGMVEIAAYCTECEEVFWGEQYWVKGYKPKIRPSQRRKAGRSATGEG